MQPRRSPSFAAATRSAASRNVLACASPPSWIERSSIGGLFKRVEDGVGLGAGRIVRVNVEPAQPPCCIENGSGWHRQFGGAVGVRLGQVESLLALPCPRPFRRRGE